MEGHAPSGLKAEALATRNLLDGADGRYQMKLRNPVNRETLVVEPAGIKPGPLCHKSGNGVKEHTGYGAGRRGAVRDRQRNAREIPLAPESWGFNEQYVAAEFDAHDQAQRAVIESYEKCHKEIAIRLGYKESESLTRHSFILTKIEQQAQEISKLPAIIP